ncbi:MAG: hypothetical protein U0802_17605 [Candidatus Binatia bacterium]
MARPERQRPHRVPRLVGSHAALTAATGWQPRIVWAQTLADVLAASGLPQFNW